MFALWCVRASAITHRYNLCASSIQGETLVALNAIIVKSYAECCVLVEGTSQHRSCNNILCISNLSFDEREIKRYVHQPQSERVKVFFWFGFRRFVAFCIHFNLSEWERTNTHNLIFKFDGNLYVISMLRAHFRLFGCTSCLTVNCRRSLAFRSCTESTSLQPPKSIHKLRFTIEFQLIGFSKVARETVHRCVAVHVVENQSANFVLCLYLAYQYSIGPMLRSRLIHFASEADLISILIEFRRKFDEISIDQYLIDVHDSTTIDWAIDSSYSTTFPAILLIGRIAQPLFDDAASNKRDLII